MESRQTTDEFNFVGLTRSPVKQTPVAGYYDARGASGNRAGYSREPSSAATTERMSDTGGSNSCSGGGGGGHSSMEYHHQRRDALQPVARNVLLDASAVAHTPSASFVPFSSSSSRIISASSIDKRPLPVSRTLKMSPDATDNNAADSMVNCKTRNVSSQSIPSRSALFSANPSPISSRPAAARPVALLTPLASHRAAATATAARRRASPLPAVLSTMESSTNSATRIQQQQPATPSMLDPYSSSCSAAVIDSSDDAGEWSDCSFARGATFSPDPATPITTQTRASGAPTTVRTIYEDHEQMDESLIEMNSMSSSPGWATTNLRVGSGVTPLPPAIGGQRQGRSALRERSTAAVDNSNNENSTNGVTPVVASLLLRMSANRSMTPGSGDDRSVALGSAACAAEDVSARRVVTLDTPGAEAVLAVVGSDAVGARGSYVQEEGALEEEEEEEEELVPQERSEMSMDVQVPSSATSPGSPTRTTSMRNRRPMTTPRRPIAASALLELSEGTPRHMIRGIIGGVAQAGTPHHRQQRFVPQVTKVLENLEEETPRRFIMGMVGDRQAGRRKAAASSSVSVPAFGSSHPRASSTADAAAAAAAAAASAAAARAAAVVAPAAAAAESSEGRGEHVDGEGAPGVLRTSAAQASAAPVPVAEVVAATSAHDGGHQRLGMGKVLVRTIVILSVTAFVCIALFGFVVLVCIAFAGPPLTVPIH